jgi:hypothetical protein
VIRRRLLVPIALAALAVAAPATAEPPLTIVAPGPGEIVAGDLHVAVTGVGNSGAEVLVSRDGEVLAGPEPLHGPADGQGPPRWEALLDVAAVDNGLAAVEVRDVAGSRSVLQYVLLNSPPPVPHIAVWVGGGTGTVSWEALGGVPLSAARIEHARPGEEGFAVAVDLDPAALLTAGSFALGDLAPGEHRLRLTVERPAGLGDMLSSSSEVVAVGVDDPEGSRFRSAQGGPPEPVPAPQEHTEPHREPATEPPPPPRSAPAPRITDEPVAGEPAEADVAPPPLAAGPEADEVHEPPAAPPAPRPTATVSRSLAPPEPPGDGGVVALVALLLAAGLVTRHLRVARPRIGQARR